MSDNINSSFESLLEYLVFDSKLGQTFNSEKALIIGGKQCFPNNDTSGFETWCNDLIFSLKTYNVDKDLKQVMERLSLDPSLATVLQNFAETNKTAIQSQVRRYESVFGTMFVGAKLQSRIKTSSSRTEKLEEPVCVVEIETETTGKSVKDIFEVKPDMLIEVSRELEEARKAIEMLVNLD